jgi:HEAT repeat protein
MHGTATRVVLTVCLLQSAAAVCHGDPLIMKSPEQERPDPARLTALIHQLGDNNFWEREAASEALEELGEPVMEDLRKIANSDEGDLEMRHRAGVIVDKIEVRLGLQKGPASSEELIGHLKESKYPSYREWAAEQLAFVNDNSRPAAIEALLAACKDDSASNVRLACIRSIGMMKMGTPAVVKALRELKKDADPRVAAEAGKTFASLPRQLPPPVPQPERVRGNIQ